MRGRFGRAGIGRAVLAAVLLVGLAGWCGPLSAEPRRPIRLRLATIAPDGSPWADALRAVKRRIERDSGGRIKVTLFLGGRRGDEQQMLTDLLRGKLQAAALSNGIITTVVPAFQVLELPFLLREPAEADWIIDEVIGPELERRARDKGLVIGLWSENGWRSIATRSRPVRKPADCRGLKVRSQQSAINTAFWTSLGAQPVRIPLHEVLSALEAGVVEGYDQTPVYSVAAGWYTQIRYFTLTEHIYQPAALVFSSRFLEGLPEELRRIVLAERERVTRETRAAVRRANRELLDFLRGQGVEVITLSPQQRTAFVQRTARVYDEVRASIGPELVDRVQRALARRRAERAAQRD